MFVITVAYNYYAAENLKTPHMHDARGKDITSLTIGISKTYVQTYTTSTSGKHTRDQQSGDKL